MASVLIDGEGVGLAARGVQRPHELPAQPLTQRVERGELLELGHEARGVAERDVGLEPLLGGLDTQFFQPGDRRGGEGSPGDVGERGPAPQAERAAQLLGPRGRIVRREGGGHQAFEHDRVHLVRRDAEAVAARP